MEAMIFWLLFDQAKSDAKNLSGISIYSEYSHLSKIRKH
jgi:hypothetical protein